MEKNKNKQLQEQITISAYEMEVIQKSFTNVLRWTEFLMSKIYKENPDFYNGWKRQISEKIKREDLDSSEEVKGFMEVSLQALDGIIEDKPEFIGEGLQEQFYSWLDHSGINAENCPKRLAECLVNVEKVLNNQGKEFVERVDKEVDEDIAKMSRKERRENFHRTFTIAQKLMEKARARKEELKDKDYRETDSTNKFSGSSEKGKGVVSQIKSSYENRPKIVDGYRLNNNPEGAVVLERNGEIYEPATNQRDFAELGRQLSDKETEILNQEIQKTQNQANEKYYLIGSGGILAVIGGWGIWLFRNSGKIAIQ